MHAFTRDATLARSLILRIARAELAAHRVDLLRLLEDRVFGEHGIKQAPFSTPPEGDWYRAGGDTICERCGLAYREHPHVAAFPLLTLLCDGGKVKL